NQIGGVMVPINVLYSSDELAHLLTDAQCTGLLTEPKFLPQFLAIRGKCPSVRVRVLARSETPEADFDLLRDVERDGDAEFRPVAVSALDPSQIIYTSGTTSRPKGAIISHRASV